MRKHLSIRPAVAAEREHLEALQWRASLANAGDRDVLRAHPDAIHIPPNQIASNSVYVAERGGVIVGFAAIVYRADGDIELDGLFVEPEVWRNGAGATLVGYCAQYARDHGASALHVTGNPHAAEFYAACGFTLIGAEETRFGPGMLLTLRV